MILELKIKALQSLLEKDEPPKRKKSNERINQLLTAHKAKSLNYHHCYH